MPSGWGVYYIVFLAAFLALGIPAALSLLSSLFSKRAQESAPPSSGYFRQSRRMQEGGPVHPGRSFNTRFFLAANAAIILISLVLVLIPCVGIMTAGADKKDIFLGVVSIISVAGFASAGLLYSVRKGDLGWLRSYQEKADE